MARSVFVVSMISMVSMVVGCSTGEPPDPAPGLDLTEDGARANGDAQTALADRLNVERTLAERDERYLPSIVPRGVQLSQPNGPRALIDRRGASIEIGMVHEVRMAVVAVSRRDARAGLALDVSPAIVGPEARRELAPSITEWWRALPSGLEHGVTLAQPVAGSGPLTVDVEVLGLRPRSTSREAVALLDVDAPDQLPVATYAHLLVMDADGSHVPAHMHVVDHLIRIEVDDADARYPLVVDPLIASQEATLLAAGAVPGESLGQAVALTADASRALVGAIGSARVFRRTGASWVEEASLPSPSSAGFADDIAGFVALTSDGSRALVGSPFDDTAAGVDAGSARVYARSGTTWSLEATLHAAGAAAGDKFGFSVSLTADGSRALVGVPFDDARPGSARVFVRSGSSWTEEATLSTGSSLGWAGYSVSLSADGQLALVGAPDEDNAFTFARSGTTWTRGARLVPPPGGGGGIGGIGPVTWFGRAVALSADGSRALVGAERADTVAGRESGNAHVFTRVGPIWVHETVLIGSGFRIRRHFGRSVALSANGSRALVGAPDDDLITGFGGSARLFVRTGAGWVEDVSLRQPGAARADLYDRLGRSVALSSDGSRALVGVDRDDTAAGSNAGSARVFTISAPLPAGTACTTAAECSSGECVDGVCCENACGGGATDDCQACSVAAGGGMDGSCTSLSAAIAPTVTCRMAVDACDVPETCSPSSSACPADARVAGCASDAGIPDGGGVRVDAGVDSGVDSGVDVAGDAGGAVEGPAEDAGVGSTTDSGAGGFDTDSGGAGADAGVEVAAPHAGGCDVTGAPPGPADWWMWAALILLAARRRRR